jgi:uncharacterized membrane protein
MRSVLLTVALSVGLGGVSSSAPVAPGITVTQPADSAETEGDVVIDGEAADIYAAVANYSKWTQIMPDVAKVEITEQHGVDALVTLVSPSGHRDNLHFHNQPDAHQIWFEDTGNHGRADVWAKINFVPAAQPAMTRVHITLYAKVHGIARLVASEGHVRSERESKITAELTHIRDYFRKEVAVASH